MSLAFGLRTVATTAIAAFRANIVNRTTSVRSISRSVVTFNEEKGEEAKEDNEVYVDPSKDRRNPHSVETSIRYLASAAYKETYGSDPVWKMYRRNHKGMYPPKKTRKTCVRGGIISTGNPCPICRDEYLIMDYRNIELLKQFISEFNGATLSYKITGICQKQHTRLLIAVIKARDYGLITFDMPLRTYDYSDWYQPETENQEKAVHCKVKYLERMGSLRGKFVIVGGGIAGVSCAESLAFLTPDDPIILITSSPLVKAVTNVVPLGTTLMQFDVEERRSDILNEQNPSITVIEDTLIGVDASKKCVSTHQGRTIYYDKLCICTGAKPRLISPNNDHVIGIRDTESVENLSSRIVKARRIIVVGNGGIATELVHRVSGLEIVWVIKDKHISATFFDPGAAEFFQDKLHKDQIDETEIASESKRMRYTITKGVASQSGPSLGPDWLNDFTMRGKFENSAKVSVEYRCEVSKIVEPSEITENCSMENWPIYASLTNGKVIGCDFIISATGVSPCSDIPGLENLAKSEDGGFSVDWKMETSCGDIYAAGDVCTANWDLAEHWFQMRLWTQAHQMGRYAAKSMFSSLANENFHQDFCFELFTHVTKFFGYKVVLLGLYNAQKLDRDYEILLRMTKGREYIKLVLKNGKMQGAVLIGDTDLEEMCENLILNQLDLSIYGQELLNPDIDIEDYFD